MNKGVLMQINCIMEATKLSNKAKHDTSKATV
jgi:hypothetical protein